MSSDVGRVSGSVTRRIEAEEAENAADFVGLRCANPTYEAGV